MKPSPDLLRYEEGLYMTLTPSMRNPHLVVVAGDWCLLGDHAQAKTTLLKVEVAYLTDQLPADVVQHDYLLEALRGALANIIEVFGADFAKTLHPQEKSC